MLRQMIRPPLSKSPPEHGQILLGTCSETCSENVWISVGILSDALFGTFSEFGRRLVGKGVRTSCGLSCRKLVENMPGDCSESVSIWWEACPENVQSWVRSHFGARLERRKQERRNAGTLEPAGNGQPPGSAGGNPSQGSSMREDGRWVSGYRRDRNEMLVSPLPVGASLRNAALRNADNF